MGSNKFDISGKRIWVAGHRGMVGQALTKRLAEEDCDVLVTDRKTVDLRNQQQTHNWLKANKPDAIFVAAAKVGGIWANHTFPADFIYENLVIETNIIHGAFLAEVKKLVFLGSSCIYPKLASQPMQEDALLTGPLEPTNEWYAVAKIAGIKMCQAYRRQYGCDFISAMPTNLFGPADNYNEKDGHVVAALIQKAHRAKLANDKNIELWGTGTPLREFLYSGDLASALVFLLQNYSEEQHINIGSGIEHSIYELAETISHVVGFEGGFTFDASKPDGVARKLMDSTRLAKMGWQASTSLKDGLQSAYNWYLEHHG